MATRSKKQQPKKVGKTSIYLDRIAYTDDAVCSGDMVKMAHCDYNMMVFGTPMGDPEERWSPIALNPEYEVSSKGNVRRITIIDLAVNKPSNPNKYPLVSVRPVGGRRTMRQAHTLVAQTFLGPRQFDQVVRHLTSDKFIIHTNALAYGTQQQNIDDKRSPKRRIKPPEDEQWVRVTDYLGLWVSNWGRFRQCTVEVLTPSKTIYKSGKRTGCKKHVSLKVAQSGRKAVYQLLHRVVWESFNGAIPDGLVVAHLNGDPHDNRLENLAVKTHRNNLHDRFAHGTAQNGERHRNSKLSDEDARNIVHALSRMPVKRIAEEYNVSEPTIYKIGNGERWSAVTGIPPRIQAMEEPMFEILRRGVHDGKSTAELARATGWPISKVVRCSQIILNAGL